MKPRLQYLLVFVVFGLGFMIAVRALGHDFYDPWCCNERDCKPYPAEKVMVHPNGYWLPEFKKLIPFEQVRKTPPHASEPFHLCEYPMNSGEVRCFYAPEAGS